jgi:hypothetical protein
VTVASRKQIVAPISFYCHDKFCSFISLFLVAIKNSLAHLTYEDRKISKLNCFVLTKLKIKNRIGPAHRRLRRGEKTWEGKKRPTPFLAWRGPVRLVGGAPREGGRRRAAPQAGRRRRICSGSAVANTSPLLPAPVLSWYPYPAPPPPHPLPLGTAFEQR